MKAVIFTVESKARQSASRIDLALGYPKRGKRVDGTEEPEGKRFDTPRYCEVRKHPSRAEWALMVDATVEPHLVTPEDRDLAELPADWTPAGP